MMTKPANATLSIVNDGQDHVNRLLKDFKSGDAKAFSRLYDLYVNVLYNYGHRLTTDSELLKDCIHDVFVRVYMRRNEVDCIANFKSYIFISLKNKICDEIRRRVYLSDTAVEDIEPVSGDDVESRYLRAEKESHENNRLEYMMNQLSPRQREALTLYYIEEKKYEDICMIMNMNYQSVRNLMHRGLTKLRSLAV